MKTWTRPAKDQAGYRSTSQSTTKGVELRTSILREWLLERTIEWEVEESEITEWEEEEVEIIEWEVERTIK